MKIYDKYLKLKSENSEKMYLFKSGNFYIFLDEDAEKINDFMVLKKTAYNKEIIKCGFPISSLDNYLKVFNNLNLDVEVIDTISSSVPDDIFDYIKKIDLNKITPIKSLSILKELQDMIK